MMEIYLLRLWRIFEENRGKFLQLEAASRIEVAALIIGGRKGKQMGTECKLSKHRALVNTDWLCFRSPHLH